MKVYHYWGVIILLLSQLCNHGQHVAAQIPEQVQFHEGALIRADTTQSIIYLMFTGGDFNDGGKRILKTLTNKKIKAHFFFTGDFYRLPANRKLIKKLHRRGHYLGPHSDKHLLYASWDNRDSLLVTKEEFEKDLLDNYEIMSQFDIQKKNSPFFMPPYEWYNKQISDWALELDVLLVNFTYGTRSNADYTTPDMRNKYVGSETIYQSIIDYEQKASNGLNGFFLLIHIGTHPSRTDKFYDLLPQLIDDLRERGYEFSLLK